MRSSTVRRLAGVLLVIAVGAAQAGCARQVAGPSLVLRLATPDRPTDVTGAQVTHFVAEVARRSRGAIRIDPVWDVTPNGAHDWDQTLARGVADGRWEMGLVPGRAWDVLGVKSLRALNTPFLITSEGALQVVLDSRLRADLLAGLPVAGVTGLDLFPDQLRHPFGYDRALLGADDYSGQSIRAPTSETTREVFAALGATTTDDDPDSGRQRGDESSYILAQGHIATGNVTLYPKTDTVVVRTVVRERLRSDQWTLLHEAAAATRDWLFAQATSDQSLALAFCNQGGEIVTASATQVSSLRRAVAPLVAKLRGDAATGRLIDDIRSLVHGLPPEPSLPSCPQRASSSDDVQLKALDGTYVTTVTEKQLEDAGEHNPERLRENSGHITYVLNDGHWTAHQVADHYIANPDDSGRYTYVDGLFTFYWSAAPDDWTSARLEIDRAGNIHFRAVKDGHPDLQNLSEGFFREWTRVGGLPR